MSTPRDELALVCPRCHHRLAGGGDQLSCPRCGLVFPVEHGIADFSGGEYYDSFVAEEQLSVAQREGLENEVAGTRSRIEDFYLPLVRSLATHRAGPALRVLDSGCGNGISIDMFQQAGIDAWGNDISALRKWQWRERSQRHRLVVADTRKLPFADGYFNVVISSGVLEHIGVHETGGEIYTVHPLPNRDAARIEFLSELLRVLAPDGKLLLDFPNGAFPIDFWHGITPGGARFHSLKEGFLPTVGEIREYVQQIGHYSVEALSPHRRLRMRQVGGHWYGRALRLPMTAFLRLMNLPGFRSLAATPLNPYLVLQVESRPLATQDIEAED